MEYKKFTPDIRRNIERLAKDEVRINSAFDSLECLESMVLFRGGDYSARMKVMKLLKEMHDLIKEELGRITYYEEDELE